MSSQSALLNLTEKPPFCWCFFIDTDKYQQRHSIQNILPEQEYWLKKHRVNDNRRLDLFKQYEEQKKSASQLAEY